MKFKTEPRGGYDEWSDKRTVVVGLRQGKTEGVDSRFFTLSDTNGNDVEVELPLRKSSHITIKRTTPEYEVKKVPLDEFESVADLGSGEIRFEEAQGVES